MGPTLKKIYGYKHCKHLENMLYGHLTAGQILTEGDKFPQLHVKEN